MTSAIMPTSRIKGFTLVEMLTVVAVMGILAVLSVPAIQGLQRADGFGKSVYGMSDAFNLARAYAMANNTYVYVGLTEVDCTQGLSASPQNPGTGRVALSIVATADGTSDSRSSWSSAYPTGSNLRQVRPVQVFDFFHIASSTTSTPFMSGSGNMALPENVQSTSVTLVPVPNSTTLTTSFSIPLGVNVGSGKYNFNNSDTDVICFTPEGEALLNGTAAQWLEIDLEPMAGTAVPSAPTNVNQGNHAALLIDGITGAVAIHRP